MDFDWYSGTKLLVIAGLCLSFFGFLINYCVGNNIAGHILIATFLFLCFVFGGM